MPSSASPVPDPGVVPNNWNAYGTDEVAIWESTLPSGLSGEEILAWQEAVLVAGEQHSIMRVLDAPTWDYRRDRDGPVVEWLRWHGDRIEPVPPFPSGFLVGRIQAYTVAALLAYSGPDGIVETWASDVANFAVAVGLPWPGADYPPVTVEPAVWDDDSFTVSFGTAIDIWFARNEARHRVEPGPVDNRALARLNGPRLNAFLNDVRTACEVVGGTWIWSTVASSDGYRQVDNEGFVLLE